MVLELVKRILTIRTVPVELAQGQDFTVQRGHQRGVFPDLPIWPDRGKAEPRLSGVAVIDD